MKRFRSWAGVLCALGLLAASIAVWVRSYYVHDYLEFEHEGVRLIKGQSGVYELRKWRFEGEWCRGRIQCLYTFRSYRVDDSQHDVNSFGIRHYLPGDPDMVESHLPLSSGVHFGQFEFSFSFDRTPAILSNYAGAVEKGWIVAVPASAIVAILAAVSAILCVRLVMEIRREKTKIRSNGFILEGT